MVSYCDFSHRLLDNLACGPGIDYFQGDSRARHEGKPG